MNKAPQDVAPLITWGLVLTQGPNKPRQNLGIYRQQVLNRNPVLMRWMAHRGARPEPSAPVHVLPKFIVVVDDDDVDVRDWKEVIWALTTHVGPVRDTMMVENTPIDHLDFASHVSEWPIGLIFATKLVA